MTNNLQMMLAAFMMGLLGSVHCISMCGGIVSALCYACPQQRTRHWQQFFYQLIYSVGRVTTYALLGAVTGFLGVVISRRLGVYGGDILRSISSVMIVLMGFYVAGWWHATAWLERAGSVLWRPFSKVTRYFYPVSSFKRAFALGSAWGLLPCGLIYSALVFSLGAASWQAGAAVMLFFGLGTMPALLLVGSAIQSYRLCLSQRWVRNLSGITMIILGLAPLLLKFFQHGAKVCAHC